ncbi:MAG: phenylalanine--tRNA ligase subunit beta [Lactovum sp.]
MQVSYKWLKELLPDLTVTARELEEKMSTTGIEVEGIYSPENGLSKLVVGEILSIEDIPDTHLHITKVEVAEQESLQIVCGADNVRVGMKVITALVGAKIVDNHKIKKGKIRGVASNGMLCALDELGISDKINPMKHEEGIYELPAEAKNGESIFPYLDMDDEVLELSITPNRADALSMRGVAHEVSAIYNLPLSFAKKEIKEVERAAKDKISIKVETDNVATYKIRIIENVTIKKSPLWLQNRLMNAGVKPINNVVDVTNYVLMYYGQPLHSFDFNKLASDEILVRQAKKNEKIITLDATERQLSEEDIVITAKGVPVALAGVMGGLDSEITNETTTVALEAAIFDSLSIRKSSQKFNLRSESSSRFEKGINESTVTEALDYAAAMIAELSEGEVLSGIVESNDYKPEAVKVEVTLEEIHNLLGVTLEIKEIEQIFNQLAFSTETKSITSREFRRFRDEGTVFICEIPAHRWDIRIAADLVEEVARIYGYDRLPVSLPSLQTSGERTDFQKLRLKVRKSLEASGLSEVIAYSLVSSEKALEFSGEKELTSLMLPMSEERTSLRTSMIPGLLDIINYNQNRKKSDLAIYEIGNVFLTRNKEDEHPEQCTHLAFALTGKLKDKSWHQEEKSVDFYDLKGIVEELLIGYEKLEFQAISDKEGMHPGRTAIIKIKGQEIGFLGQVHPVFAKKYDIKETYVAELDIQLLLNLSPKQVIFKEIPKIQASSRDLALLLDENIQHSEVESVILESKVKSLSEIRLFDIYSGEKLSKGKKSMAYSLTFQALGQSLTDEEINLAVNKITKQLEEKLSVEIR